MKDYGNAPAEEAIGTEQFGNGATVLAIVLIVALIAGIVALIKLL